jgi:hypothetical protein
MSRLSVYWPDECHTISKASHEQPVILRFPTAAPTMSAPAEPLDIISRARLIFENRRCCQCGYPVVKPVELDDALTNTSGLAIPGSATLVGFECTSCDASWSI